MCACECACVCGCVAITGGSGFPQEVSLVLYYPRSEDPKTLLAQIPLKVHRLGCSQVPFIKYVALVMKMGNIAPRAGIEPIHCSSFQDSTLVCFCFTP